MHGTVFKLAYIFQLPCGLRVLVATTMKFFQPPFHNNLHQAQPEIFLNLDNWSEKVHWFQSTRCQLKAHTCISFVKLETFKFVPSNRILYLILYDVLEKCYFDCSYCWWKLKKSSGISTEAFQKSYNLHVIFK